MTLGEVAGTACALARRLQLPLSELGRQRAPLRQLRAALTAQGVRVAAPSVSGPGGATAPDLAFALLDMHPDAYALNLLRRGMMSAPYSLRGQLGGDEPILAADFLSSLDHWLTARGTDAEQRRTMSELLAWGRAQPNRVLTWATGRAIFQALHEDDWEFQNLPRPLRRRDAARLLTDMFPAADRQAPALSAISRERWGADRAGTLGLITRPAGCGEACPE